ncbi:hypothetical protein FJY63_00885 [Candidatus Sumerlaeota bacterium]|nr:hypothetical protein [Candidatus Sumerlaeota bacterium]
MKRFTPRLEAHMREKADDALRRWPDPEAVHDHVEIAFMAWPRGTDNWLFRRPAVGPSMVDLGLAEKAGPYRNYGQPYRLTQAGKQRHAQLREAAA